LESTSNVNHEQFDKLTSLGFDLEQKVGGFNFYEWMITLGNFDLLLSTFYAGKAKKFVTKQNVEKICNYLNQIGCYNNIFWIQDYCDKNYGIKVDIPFKGYPR